MDPEYRLKIIRLLEKMSKNKACAELLGLRDASGMGKEKCL